MHLAAGWLLLSSDAYREPHRPLWPSGNTSNFCFGMGSGRDIWSELYWGMKRGLGWAYVFSGFGWGGGDSDIRLEVKCRKPNSIN